MPIPTPEVHARDTTHAERMMPAIEAGSVAAAREVFATQGAPSQFRLKHYFSELMWLDDYEDMARHARSENTLSRTIMAKSAPEFETGLADIVRLMAKHTTMAPKGDTFNSAQNAFNIAYKPYRLPALLAVVQETLLQDPSWKPDIIGIFSGIGIDKGETRQQVEEYRTDRAEHINTLGAAVSKWLATEAPPSLMMRMSAPDQQYWRKEGWHTDAKQMPWQSPTAQMEEFAFITAFVLAMPITESSKLNASPEGLRAQELTRGALQRAANGLKRD